MQEENAFKRKYFLPHYSCVYPCVRSPSTLAPRSPSPLLPDSLHGPSVGEPVLHFTVCFSALIVRSSGHCGCISGSVFPFSLTVPSRLTSSSRKPTAFKAAISGAKERSLQQFLRPRSLPEGLGNRTRPPVGQQGSVRKSLPLLSREQHHCPHVVHGRRNRLERPHPR